MSAAPLIFLDTETTSLEHDADVWEFAAIRREPDGSETELHLFIEHDENKCRKLPESFRADHLARFPGHGQELSRKEAVHEIHRFAGRNNGGERPHIIGAVPDFDVQRIERMFRAEVTFRPDWHYHLIDVENLAVGWMAGLRAARGGENGRDGDLPSLPWISEDVSLAVGVDPDQFARHTAMGDAKWARAIYDAVMGDRA